MEWYAVLALVLGIPLILFPVAIVLYLNIGGVYQMMRSEPGQSRCLDRRGKLLISVLLAPLTTVVIAAFLVAVAFVCFPLFVVAIPVILAVGLISAAGDTAGRRVARPRSRG